MIASLFLLLLGNPSGAVVVPNATSMAINTTSPTVAFTPGMVISPNASSMALTPSSPTVTFVPPGVVVVSPNNSSMLTTASSPLVTYYVHGTVFTPQSGPQIVALAPFVATITGATGPTDLTLIDDVLGQYTLSYVATNAASGAWYLERAAGAQQPIENPVINFTAIGAYGSPSSNRFTIIKPS